jgi:hypothetical protein
MERDRQISSVTVMISVMPAAVRRIFVCVPVLLLFATCGCNRKPVNPGDTFTADVTIDGRSIGSSELHGHLFLSKDHLLVDWGLFKEAFDLKKRTGWRAFASTKVYQELPEKGLSTYAPLMSNGSLCPNVQVPSACKLVGKEELDGRVADKWDVWNPKGFHVYYWTDERLAITLRCEIGKTIYEVTHLREGTVSEALFDIPAGYQRVEDVLEPTE